jgi:hypothetical protein
MGNTGKSTDSMLLRGPNKKPPLGEGLISARIRNNTAKLLLRCLCGFGVLAAEALNASGGVHQLLLAGEEWMAI